MKRLSDAAARLTIAAEYATLKPAAAPAEGGEAIDSERYRSGHNEAVLKTVWEQSHMGSNPILSAKKSSLRTAFLNVFSFLSAFS